MQTETQADKPKANQSTDRPTLKQTIGSCSLSLLQSIYMYNLDRHATGRQTKRQTDRFTLRRTYRLIDSHTQMDMQDHVFRYLVVMKRVQK